LKPNLAIFLWRRTVVWPSANGRVRAEFVVISSVMQEQQHIEVEGRVTTVLPGTMFRVELDNKHLVLATICGKMRKRWVRLTVGDRVKMEMSPYDLNKARITWRLK
jgi:translation initiation factor IF-1